MNEFPITDFGAVGDGQTINTEAIQQAIEALVLEGGGTVVVPKGRFRSGAVFFRPGTHLRIEAGGVLLGSDEIEDYPRRASRIEGVSQEYHPALVNAYDVPGFTITGPGTIDGNGLKFWQAFWARREENPDCTNLEVARPRLVFIWGCDDVRIEGVKLHNSGFWTTHLYQCERVKILNCDIFAPREPVRAPSSDAIDLDVCSDVLIKGCTISVNDDGVCMKGGKGPYADEDATNGIVRDVVVEDCTFGWVHSVLTLGSESIHSRNIVMRNCRVEGAWILLRLKLRPDTPQLYEHVTIEHVTGNVDTVLHIKPWTQFFDLGGRASPPSSFANNIKLRNLDLDCRLFSDIGRREGDVLADFWLENLDIRAEDASFNESVINGVEKRNVQFTKAEYRGGPRDIDEM